MEALLRSRLVARLLRGLIFDIRDAVTVSGIPGVTIPWHQPDRKSDTEITVELEFNGNIDRDAILTFTVGAGAVPGYFGPAIAAQIPVTAVTETVVASTAPPLTEATLEGSVVTLTLSGRAYASIFDIRDAVKVSGIDGVTTPWHQPERKSDTKITIRLEFNGDIEEDATLTFTVGADAIKGYGGSALTAQLPVTAYTAVAASTVPPLTEATLDGSVVTLRLDSRAYAESIQDIRRELNVSGVAGATVNTSSARRVNDREVTVELEFNGNIDANANLILSVGANAIAGYNGPALTTRLLVTAHRESVAASTVPPLTEATLDGSVVTLRLDSRAYAESIQDIRRELNVSGVTGATVNTSSARRVNDREVTVELEFNGNIDANANLILSVGANAIAGYNGPALTTRLLVTAHRESVTASTPSPLAEHTLDGNVVTLTLYGRGYAESLQDIRDAVKVSGIAGVTILWRGLDRKSDTEVTVELEFNGGIDADATLTFTVEADAIANYNGANLSAQLPVTAYTAVAASTVSPLTEATLDGSVVALTLDSRAYTESIRDVRRALKMSGIAGATVNESNTKRVSDTVVTVAIEFNGDIDVDANLTFSVGKDAITGYGGPALTAQLPVTAYTESVTVSTASPLTEPTLDGSIVTLTLNGRAFAESIWDIRRAVKVSGTAGVTVSTSRVSDTEVTVKLEFNGDIDADTTLTFSVGADGIAGYNGPALTAQLPVTASIESVAASTTSPLAEATLEGSVVTLTLSGRNYVSSSRDISRALTITGIDGVTKDSVGRISDTEATVELEFNGDFDADATLTFTVGADAIAGYGGPALSAQVVVSGGEESVIASTASSLTEATLNESVVTLTLNGRAYAESIWDIRRAVKVSGTAGVTVSTSRVSDTEVTVKLEFNGDIDADTTLTFSVGADGIAGYNGPALTAQLPVTASIESVAASTTSPLAEATLEGSVVTLTLSGRNYVSSSWDISRALTITGIDGVTKDSVRRISNTEVTVELEFRGDFDIDATLTFTVGPGAIADYNGPAFTQQIPVTGGPESIIASTAVPLTEATLDGGVVTLTLGGRAYEQSIWDVQRAVNWHRGSNC